MNNDSRKMAAKSAMLLANSIEQIRSELREDPAYERCAADPMIVGLLLVQWQVLQRRPWLLPWLQQQALLFAQMRHHRNTVSIPKPGRQIIFSF